ncbi:MAG: hypothetical protein ACOZAI_03705 [Pseudomonadota bacterium]
MQKRTLLAAAFLAACSTSVLADGVAVGANAGTKGLGLELTHGVLDNLNVRGAFNTFSYGYDTTEDGIKYDGDLDLRNAGLMLDWFPFRGSFRMSAGAMYNGNKFKGKGNGSGVYELGADDTRYTIDGELRGEIDWRNFAPYVGLGWGNPVAKNWGFTFDVGVMFTGSPDARLTATGTATPEGGTPIDVSTDPTFQQHLAEEQARLNDEIEDAKFWPVVQLGLHYKF